VFEETDDEAPDSWTHSFGTYRCPFVNVEEGTIYLDDIECMIVYSLPMDYVAHIQTYHPDVDLDSIFPVDVDLDSGPIPDVDLDRKS
jgi:hypothetical protein